MEAISPRAPAKKASLCAMNRVFMVFPPITGQEAAWATFCLIVCGVVVIFVVFFFLNGPATFFYWGSLSPLVDTRRRVGVSGIRSLLLF